MAPELRQPHEAPAVQTRRIVAFGLGFVAFAILLGGGLKLYYRWTTAGETRTVALKDFPAPRLQPNPGRDWTVFSSAQRQALDGYGWADRSRTLVHIPIERAMALVAARGAAAYDPVAGVSPAPGGAPLDGAPRATPQAVVAPYGDVH